MASSNDQIERIQSLTSDLRILLNQLKVSRPNPGNTTDFVNTAIDSTLSQIGQSYTALEVVGNQQQTLQQERDQLQVDQRSLAKDRQNLENRERKLALDEAELRRKRLAADEALGTHAGMNEEMANLKKRAHDLETKETERVRFFEEKRQYLLGTVERAESTLKAERDQVADERTKLNEERDRTLLLMSQQQILLRDAIERGQKTINELRDWREGTHGS